MKLEINKSQIEVMEVALQKLARSYPNTCLAAKCHFNSYQPNQSFFQTLIFLRIPQKGVLSTYPQPPVRSAEMHPNPNP
jgi:hypothetical protein